MAATINKKSLIKLIISTAIAFAVSQIPAPAGLEPVAMTFIGVFVWLILLMSLRIFPEYISVLLTLFALLAFKVGSAEAVFSQFTSSTLWNIIAILALASAIQKTTVLTRVAMYVLKPFPATYAGQVGAIMLASLAMSFVLPSIFAKIMILAPIALSICETAKFEKSSKPAAGLFCAIFVSSFFLSNFFTTGNSNVQVMFAFAKTPFTFFEWMKFTSVWMIIMTLGTYLFIVGFFGPKGKLDLSKDYIQRQIEALPPMSANDKKAAAILIISVILWMTESLHGISALAVTILAYCAFTATGISTPDEFKAKVDWTLVIVIGGILSVASFISSLGIATYLSGTLGPVLAPIVINKWFFIPVLTVLVFLSRYIIVSQIGTLTIFIAIFQALVVPLGYHPMVVVFCSNMIIQLWATNYNNVLIKPAYAMTRNRLVEHKDVAPMAYALFVLSIIAYVASIPLWTSMGMLG